MYCPTCGEETPDNSKFCLHCGSSISKPSRSTVEKPHKPTEWEYKEYVYTWTHEQIYYNSNTYEDTQVRVDVWMNYQSKILEELQKWYDEGWQPIGEVGPSSIRLNYFSKWNWWGSLLVTIFTAGLGIFLAPFNRTPLAEPAEFRLKMRRPVSKKPITPMDSENSYRQRTLTQEREESVNQAPSTQPPNIKVYKRYIPEDNLTPVRKTNNNHGQSTFVVGGSIWALIEIQCPWCEQDYEISKEGGNVFFKCEKCQNIVFVTRE